MANHWTNIEDCLHNTDYSAKFYNKKRVNVCWSFTSNIMVYNVIKVLQMWCLNTQKNLNSPPNIPTANYAKMSHFKNWTNKNVGLPRSTCLPQAVAQVWNVLILNTYINTVVEDIIVQQLHPNWHLTSWSDLNNFLWFTHCFSSVKSCNIGK